MFTFLVNFLPSGSTSLEIFNASLLAKSWLAGVTANIRQLSRLTKVYNIALI